jgi:hypothetical protein
MQLRVYSYKANLYPYIYSSSAVDASTAVGGANPMTLVVSATGTTAGMLKDSQAYNQNVLMPSASVFYKITFDIARFIHKLILIGFQ